MANSNGDRANESGSVSVPYAITMEADNSDQYQPQDPCVDDPLTDCLVLISRLYGKPVSPTALKAGLPVVNNRLTVELFPRAASRAGLSSRILKRPLKAISSIELPAILLIDSEHACVAVDRSENAFTVLLPETEMGKATISMHDLSQRYSGYAIFVRPRFQLETFFQNNTVNQNKHWFWGALFANWRIYRDVLVASMLINVFGLVSPFFTRSVYDRVIPNLSFDTLWALTAGIVIVHFFNLLMRILRGYFVEEAGKKANVQISAALMRKVLSIRMEAQPESVGAFSKYLQQFASVQDFITSFSITALIDLPFILLGLLAVWYLGGAIVFIHLAAVALMACYALLIQMPLQKAISKSFHAQAKKNAILIEGLSGIETIKMLNAQSQIQRAWEESVAYIAKWAAKSRLYSLSVNHFTNFILNMTVVAVLVAGVYSISNGVLSQGGLIALIILTRQAVAPMSQVIGLATRFYHAKLSLRMLNKIMALPSEHMQKRPLLDIQRCAGRIDLKDIGFAYPNQDTAALDGINLSIAAGERIALIGPIGSGKTTLGKLILGLYKPSSGIVILDGTDIRQIDPSQLRNFIGHVPQDVALFRGTIRENIILGSPHVTENAILRAARLSGAAQFISKHPQGFDRKVGEYGRGLSGGQRQLLAMARALLHDPSILILDEPSNSMDNRSEAMLMARLSTILRGKTLILMTHRASLLRLVDRIVVISDGKIVADGSRVEILKALKDARIKI